MNELNIPFGLCEITYDGKKLPSMADEAVFSAVPKYMPLYGGTGNTVKKFILEEYQVAFTVVIDSVSYETLKIISPTLKQHEHGLYDEASNVDTTGKRLIIHPYDAGDSKEFDLCIWSAFVSPETGFTRTFKKESDKFEITFIGKPTQLGDTQSYFFIGDWEEVL